MAVLALTNDDVLDLLRCVKGDITRLNKEAAHHGEMGELILLHGGTPKNDETAAFHYTRLAAVNQQIGAMNSLLKRIELVVDQ